MNDTLNNSTSSNNVFIIYLSLDLTLNSYYLPKIIIRFCVT